MLLGLMAISCNRNPVGKDYTDTPTSGDLSIAIDDSYTLLFETQISTFEALYPNAKVYPHYVTEQQALNDVFNDSSKVAVINRELTEEELQRFKNANIYPITTPIAHDALAFIINNNNTDTTLSVKQIKNFLTGIDTMWPTQKDKKINIVFDNPHSANYSYLKKLNNNHTFGKNIFALNNNPEIIDYVSKNENALGVISVSWISDTDDLLSQEILKKVKVVAITGDEEISESTRFKKPEQAFIADKTYPFHRTVYMINRQTRAGLGTGFVSFVAGEKGQRIIKLSGLVPTIMQPRVIQITNKPLN
ncbi:MAG: substrate-binding domain-containing protein [Bacteroidia bacterium]|nr:substrate-binding domain-containing protein [Bacteroidia bacterium]